MFLVKSTFSEPVQNLAFDQALLEYSEIHDGPELLRFWESAVPFVVLGYTKPRQQEVNIAYCRDHDIAVLRRSSGGGTVLQGPGVFNYSLITKIPPQELPHNIRATNVRIMENHRHVFAQLLEGDVQVQGHTDLTWKGLKFSGNAQRRKAHYLLFHGTVLINADIELMGKVLFPPADQPQYREKRSHSQFLINLPLSCELVQKSLSRHWQASNYWPCDSLVEQNMEQLITEKYANSQWNEKF